jgi:peroxiredoxin
MKLRILILLAIITSAALSIISCTSSCPEMGKSAPDFTLQNLDGKNVSLSDFRGKTIIINFWATWCTPCQFETPFFQAIHNERASKGVVILAIDIKESSATVKSCANSKGMTFPILLDTEAEVAQKYCLPSAVPITFFVNTQGVIKARKIGAFTSQKEIENILDSL